MPPVHKRLHIHLDTTPQAFLLALEGLGLKPEETLYLDDDPENVEAARKLGLRAEVYAYQRALGS